MDVREKPFIITALPMGVRSGNDRLGISCCLSINRYYKGLSDSTAYDDFYSALQKLPSALNGDSARLTIKVGRTPSAEMQVLLEVPSQNIPANDFPFRFLVPDQAKRLALPEYENVKNKLWATIFPSNKRIHKDSPIVSRPPLAGSIQNLGSPDLLHQTQNFISTLLVENNRKAIKTFSTDSETPDITQTLQAIQEFAQGRQKRALFENLSFMSRYKGEAKDHVTRLESLIHEVDIANKAEELAKRLAETYTEIIKGYVDNGSFMEIDEPVNSFASLSNEPVLMRLLGLIRDFEIMLPAEFVPKSEPSTFVLKVELNNDTLSIPTKIKGITNFGKYAYLVSEDESPVRPKFFSNSILRVRTDQPSGGDPWLSHLYTFDKIGKESQLKAIRDAQQSDSGSISENAEDTFTRGIIFGNTGMGHMIAPVDYVFQSEGSTDLANDFSFTDDFVSHGHRVAVVINGEYYSLTGRRLELKRLDVADKDPFFVSDLNEGPIHFDAVSHYVQDGELQALTSDALFEYSGELLTLKSAFSRAIHSTAAERTMRLAEEHHDGGLSRSRERVDNALVFTRFPEELGEKKALLWCHYDLPRHFTPEHRPRLRFNKSSKPRSYTFAVYQEYLNGWALPLEQSAEFPLQLSLKDLTSDKQTYLPPPITFCPLESKKPVLLFHTTNVDEGKLELPIAQTGVQNATNKAFVDRQALETLVVWSYDAQSVSHSCSRHVLPARIAFEHAFWYDLLSEMSADQSFEWKRKYNCPFVDHTRYQEFTAGGKKCPENACTSYCGGTTMRSFYGPSPIIPNHLSDPSIVGFAVSFFRDVECKNPIDIEPIKLIFGGNPGLAPQSYLLYVEGSDDELSFTNSLFYKSLSLGLKKGMRVWAQLQNIVSDEYKEEHSCRSWYHELAAIHGTDLTGICPDPKTRNPPRTISLVHAVKKPLLEPEIEKLSSQPDEFYRYGHIEEWLKNEYAGLSIESNVVCKRAKLDEAATDELGSSLISVAMAVKFERLDAYIKEGQVEFVSNELPTGGLELWMRKEEYIDDPTQFVIEANYDKGRTVNHLPDHPVIPFNSDQSLLHREYKVELNESVLHQLKSWPISLSVKPRDVFRAITSRLELTFNAKSTVFEERRYQLRDISLFKSYFTTSENEDDQEYTAASKEHRVLLLNNKQPSKPLVSHAVTTIKQHRMQQGSTTMSKQKGNIVTVYLKRGRLTSGKNERVGVVVFNETSPYHKAFLNADHISKAGRDIVSDPEQPTASPYIRYYPGDSQRQDIIIPEDNAFDARYDPSLGILSYLPKFDYEKQLWKFEIELDIKTASGHQLHNPFVVFSLVHFQPFSLNYNANSLTAESSLQDIQRDCRISEIEPFIWCYLLPERSLSVSFDSPGICGLGKWTDFLDRWGTVDLTLSFDSESLHYFDSVSAGWILRSNFILSIQGSNDKVVWKDVMSLLDQPDGKWHLMHPLLTSEMLKAGYNEAKLRLKFKRSSNPPEALNNTIPSQEFMYFRVLLLEVEWFDEKKWEELKIKCSQDITDDERMRIRYVELIY